MAGPRKTKRAGTNVSATKYVLKDGAPEHYIDGKFYKAGSVVQLPEGVEPGKWLEAADAKDVKEAVAREMDQARLQNGGKEGDDPGARAAALEKPRK